MLTAKQNMWETVKGGHPDRYVNQYEGIQMLAHPFYLHSPSPAYGEHDVQNAWGSYHSWPLGTPGAFPVHTPDKILIKDIEHWQDYLHAPSLDFPDAEWDMFKDMYDAIDSEKCYTAAMFIPGLFEQSHHFMSMDEALVNYLEYEDEMHDFLKYMTEWELELAALVCEKLHPTAILHHDDFGSQTNSFLPPALFAEFFVEPYQQIYGYMHDHGVELIIHHSDSYGANLVEYLIEMGIDVWQGVMETNDVPALVEKYGKQITFMGNIDNKDVDFEGCTPEHCWEVAQRACTEIPVQQGYIPSITQGGPGSVYPWRYKELAAEIDRINAKNLGCTVEEIEAQREPLQIMFGSDE